MNRSESPEEFRKRMGRENTKYLKNILTIGNISDWTDEQFRTITEILVERGENIELPIPPTKILDNLFISTTHIIQDRKIEQYLGVVSSVVVLGTGFLSEVGAGIADLLGTRAGGFQEKLKNAKDIALQEIGEQAIQRGGNGIIGIDFDYMTLAANVLLVSVNGTVVKLALDETN